MGVLMWYGSTIPVEISVFANAQMFYPAAGVMLAYWMTMREDRLFPKWFYLCFLSLTLLVILLAVLSVVMPERIINPDGTETSLWMELYQCMGIAGSILCWITLLIAGKERREAYGLGWKRWNTSLFCIFLFFYTVLWRRIRMEILLTAGFTETVLKRLPRKS